MQLDAVHVETFRVIQKIVLGIRRQLTSVAIDKTIVISSVQINNQRSMSVNK